MQKLIMLYWGTVFLMYLSQVYYPVRSQIQGSQSGRYHFMRKKTDFFTMIVIFWLSAFSFLRVSYNDTYTYITTFQEAESVAEGLANGTFTDWTGNPWSMFYRSLIHDLTENYHIYFLFPAVLSSFAVVKLCKRYSVNPAFSLLIFFSIGTYVMYVAALKQCLAMFFLLLALPYAIDRKYVQFYLLVFVAIMFHTHAFMFAIVPLLLEKPWGKVTWILLGATLFAMATYDATLGAFMEYAQSIGALVAEIEVFDDHQINILRVLVYWVPAIVALVLHRRLFTDSTRTENLFVNMSLVSAFILTIGLVQGANLYARMAAYFEIATAVALPWMIKKLFTKQSAQMITTLAVILYFAYFMFEFTVSKNFNNDYAAITMWQFIQSLFG
ncbi:MAG: EpsG family protein [Oscillospiraceae bacterium]|nr:EpsG family protein [Oscillospiraceae bacterium]